MSETQKGPLAKREEEVLAFWNKEKIFEQSLQKPSPKGEYVFYDGPPFANGLPHYGHILASTIKDAVPRYRTMQGYRVARQWGWDCHGLPVENLVEKELGFKTKRDIEDYGLAKFSEAARASIMKDVSDWKRIIPRLGRWADMEHDYKTMDTTYTQSVWWAFKRLHQKGLAYEGFKAMHLCPRCGTTLSNFEVAQGYQDIDDYAVTVKLPLIDEPETSLLIWTTTPWTLPGNTAAAVNPEVLYAKVKVGEENYVVARARVEAVFGEAPQVVGEMLGRELIGKKYLPPFEYFATELHKHKTHAWKVYGADYVTTEDGTGLVHLAPAFGEEDLLLAQKEKIPVIHHVTDEGKFVATVTDFAGLPVKPKGRHMETDAKIIEHLRAKGILFKDEKVRHSYPHCWRCDTPLLNWAATSWFVNVQKIKNKLLTENSKIHWVPEHVGVGRFGKWLENARDWAISRTRYWGAPLPVWRNSKTKEIKVVGSVNELLSLVRRSGNRYFVSRHGESEFNTKGLVDSGEQEDNTLTPKGRNQVIHGALDMKREKIDLIITSPLLRTLESAKLLQKELGLPEQAVMVDERIREVNFGVFSGKRLTDWKNFFPSLAERFAKAPEGGETFADVRRRVGEFLFDIERRYTGKNILIVMHEGPAWLLQGIALRWSIADAIGRKTEDNFLQNGEIKEMSFVQFPHNAQYELDLHRPYIDEIPLGDSLTGQWKRDVGVFDCWFESGSMPFASNHYPFRKKSFNPQRFFGLAPKGFPADFIAEGLDQTRGWFYSLIVLSTALFGRSPYRCVIVNGLILAENGEKMSKRLRNYPDPMELVDRFGADALRYYLLSSSVIKGEDLRFSARGVEEVSKKILMRLDNVRSFYELYTDGTARSAASTHVLDRWILSRLNELVRDATAGFESYELDDAARPVAAFVDDLSVWYLRRSRDRFKGEEGDKRMALATLRQVLHTTARVMAPVMPFFADDLFRRVKEEGDHESVHLCVWPEGGVVDEELLKDMVRVRDVASLGLQEREKAGVKIRQPLGKLSVKALSSDNALRLLVAEEVNVKDIVDDLSLEGDVELDTALTPELKEEGMLRDMARMVQDFRKEKGLTIADRPTLVVATNEEGKAFVERIRAKLIEETGLAALEITEGGESVKDFAFPITLSFGQ